MIDEKEEQRKKILRNLEELMKVQKILIKRAKKNPMKLPKEEKPERQPSKVTFPKFVDIRRSRQILSHREKSSKPIIQLNQSTDLIPTTAINNQSTDVIPRVAINLSYIDLPMT